MRCHIALCDDKTLKSSTLEVIGVTLKNVQGSRTSFSELRIRSLLCSIRIGEKVEVTTLADRYLTNRKDCLIQFIHGNAEEEFLTRVIAALDLKSPT